MEIQIMFSSVLRTHGRIFVNFILAHLSLKEVEHDITVAHEHILRTLLYFDIFNCPLTAKEIFRFLGSDQIDQEQLQRTLDNLVTDGYLYSFGDLYSVQNNEANVTRRKNGNQEARRFLPLAEKKAKLIARFPFVRGVMASGSLSKGYMDENSDLDFFIVTKPGRLWIARMLLVMYKRIFLFNSHKHFCVNYFVDTDHLEIDEKNIFTATELATVIPLYGAEHYKNLHARNNWLFKFFPNYEARSVFAVPATKPGLFTRTLENIINFLGGDRIDHHFMRMTISRWEKLYGHEYNEQDFKVAFKSRQYASKNHPRHYQKKITMLYMEKLNTYSQKFNLSLKI